MHRFGWSFPKMQHEEGTMRGTKGVHHPRSMGLHGNNDSRQPGVWHHEDAEFLTCSDQIRPLNHRHESSEHAGLSQTFEMKKPYAAGEIQSQIKQYHNARMVSVFNFSCFGIMKSHSRYDNLVEGPSWLDVVQLKNEVQEEVSPRCMGRYKGVPNMHGLLSMVGEMSNTPSSDVRVLYATL
ncbi:hypothetical protein VNO77_23366 [Canavalia gladiata]|uniref:Uncharacterized protein n=1 Tax=Canavalia gladiata TaxID=3824 RepID=A0AAN9L4A9_CANGL